MPNYPANGTLPHRPCIMSIWQIGWAHYITPTPMQALRDALISQPHKRIPHPLVGGFGGLFVFLEADEAAPFRSRRNAAGAGERVRHNGALAGGAAGLGHSGSFQ